MPKKRKCLLVDLVLVLELPVQDVEEELVESSKVLVVVGHVLIPSRPLLGCAYFVRIDIRSAGGCQHGEAFAKGADPFHRCPGDGRQACKLGLRLRLDAGEADVVHLVRDSILKLFARDLRVQVEKDCGVCARLKDEAVLVWLDDGVQLGMDSGLRWQVRENAASSCSEVSFLPLFERGGGVQEHVWINHSTKRNS